VTSIKDRNALNAHRRRVAHTVAVEREVRTVNRRPRREVRTVRLPGGRSFALGAYAGSGAAHPFVPDGGSSTSCMLCFGWSNDHRHTSTVRAAS
jgi:hypothetical protein